MSISFIGLDKFDEEEIDTLRQLVGHHYKKMKHKDIHKFDLIVHAKKQVKAEKASSYTLTTRIDAPRLLVSAECTDYNLRKVCHEAMVKLENEFNHKFKANTSYSKPYYKR